MQMKKREEIVRGTLVEENVVVLRRVEAGIKFPDLSRLPTGGGCSRDSRHLGSSGAGVAACCSGVVVYGVRVCCVVIR